MKRCFRDVDESSFDSHNHKRVRTGVVQQQQQPTTEELIRAEFDAHKQEIIRLQEEIKVVRAEKHHLSERMDQMQRTFETLAQKYMIIIESGALRTNSNIQDLIIH